MSSLYNMFLVVDIRDFSGIRFLVNLVEFKNWPPFSLAVQINNVSTNYLIRTTFHADKFSRTSFAQRLEFFREFIFEHVEIWKI